MTKEIDHLFAPCQQAPTRGITLVESKHYINSGNCEINLNIGIFFDGTNNNQKKDKPNFGHSNVVRLFDAYKDDKQNGFYHIYIPGVGTPFPEIGEMGSSTLGSGFAIGCEARVLYGLLAILNTIHRHAYQGQTLFDPSQIKALCRNNSVSLKEDIVPLAKLGLKEGLRIPDVYGHGLREKFLNDQAAALGKKLATHGKPDIKTCFIDVFGFSRGAAEARVFCQWMDQLLSGGKMAGMPIRMRFVGLMDTVASAGFFGAVAGALTNTTVGHTGWAAPEFLHIPPTIENCVHMIAMHELRKNFPLDEINVGGVMPPHCQQFAYPGSHSDVGGGYLPEELGISLGKTAVESDSLKLAQIPLNHMLACAIAAGAPLNKKLASNTSTGYDPFAIAAPLEKAYNDFLKISTMTPRPLRDWLQPYLNWRWQMRNTYGQLNHVLNAKQDSKLLITSNKKLISDAKLILGSGNVGISKKYLAAVTGAPQANLHDGRMHPQPSIDIPQFDPEAPAVLDLAQKAQPTPEILAAFFDKYVHDSLAGFSKSLVEPTGYWRYRKGFRGNNKVHLVQSESAQAEAGVKG